MQFTAWRGRGLGVGIVLSMRMSTYGGRVVELWPEQMDVLHAADILSEERRAIGVGKEGGQCVYQLGALHSDATLLLRTTYCCHHYQSRLEYSGYQPTQLVTLSCSRPILVVFGPVCMLMYLSARVSPFLHGVKRCL